MDGQARLSTQMKSSVDFHQLLKKKTKIRDGSGHFLSDREVGFGLAIFSPSGLFLTQAVGVGLFWAAHFC